MGRRGHRVTVFDDGSGEAMFLIGGFTVNEETGYREYANDVWRSVDGINWEKLNNNDFGIRSEAGATVDPATGRIFIQGGVHGVNIQTDENQSHPIEDWHWLWSSIDGTNWIPENDTAIFDQDLLRRSDHQLVFYNNSLWGLPGKTTSNVHYHFTSSNQYPIWNRVNEETWQVDSYGCDIDPRHAYASVISSIIARRSFLPFMLL